MAEKDAIKVPMGEDVTRDAASLDALLKEAVLKAMSAQNQSNQDVAVVQNIVDRKAQHIRESVSKQVRRIRAAAAA